MIRLPRPDALIAATTPALRAYVETLEHVEALVSGERDAALLLVQGSGDGLLERWRRLNPDPRLVRLGEAYEALVMAHVTETRRGFTEPSDVSAILAELAAVREGRAAREEQARAETAAQAVEGAPRARRKEKRS